MRRPWSLTTWFPRAVNDDSATTRPSVSVLPVARHVRQAGPESSTEMRSESRLVSVVLAPAFRFVPSVPPCGGSWDRARIPHEQGGVRASGPNSSILAGGHRGATLFGCILLAV